MALQITIVGGTAVRLALLSLPLDGTDGTSTQQNPLLIGAGVIAAIALGEFIGS